jgi:glycosyltransferase involved in cell wall biosynthesis
MEDIPLGFDHTGASSFLTSHLRILAQMDICKVVTLIRVPIGGDRCSFNLDAAADYASISKKEIPFNPGERAPSLYSTLPMFIASSDRMERESLLFPVVNYENVVHLQRAIDELRPDIVWAEHMVPFLLASHADFNGKIIYSHHDFIWKLQLIRRRKLKDWLLAWMLRKIQTEALRKASGIVGGSEKELAEATAIASSAKTFFLPTIYPFVRKTLEPESGKPDRIKPVRIVHVGTLKATANKVGLGLLLAEILPLLRKAGVEYECLLVGDLNNATADLQQLMKQPGVNYKGYVENLESVLMPYDIHIIPYDQATGTRTRLTLALNYQQVVLAHRNSVEGVKGLVDGKNCLLGMDSPDLARKVEFVYRNESRKREIADQGKQWYEENFREGSFARKLQLWLTDES